MASSLAGEGYNRFVLKQIRNLLSQKNLFS